MSTQAQLGDWWEDVTSAALVGVARRSVPAPPEWLVDENTQQAAELRLLDSVAVGASLRRAGALVEPPDPAPAAAHDDRLRLAPARARQLLDLLLTQSPVGADRTTSALTRWLDEAARQGVRVHHATLLPLLTRATMVPQLREHTVPVLDERGGWLAAANPAWDWALAAAAPVSATASADPMAWAQLPTVQRAVQLRALRTDDPAGARALLDSTWGSDPAAARATLLATFEVGLSLDDEAVLERALDDRAAGVREAAYGLLDALPGAARAQRMGARLKALLTTSGLVRTKVHLELPTDPDAMAVRDGLVRAPRGRSERGFWLHRITAGAPFDAWTSTTGLEPDGIVAQLDDADALAGLRGAAIARNDVTWARALLDREWDVRLARRLPADELIGRMLDRIRHVKKGTELLLVLQLAPGPWSEDVSTQVVKQIGRVDLPAYTIGEIADVLADRLHPSTAPAVERLGTTKDDRPTGPFHQLAHYLRLIPTITESFT